jgi:hypothetical protein
MQTIGPYQLVQALGECPVGGVWSAVDADNNGATVALLTTAAAHDPGWRNAFAATANALAQSGEVPLIAGDYAGPTPWVASAARDGSVLGRVFIALGLEFQVSGHGGPAGQPGSGEQTGLATGSPQAATGSAEPVSGARQPVSGAPSEATAPISSAAPYQSGVTGYSYEPPPSGGSPYTVSPFSVPPAPPPRRSKAPLIGVLALVLVLLVGGSVTFAVVLWPDDGEPQVPQAQPTPTIGPTSDPLQEVLVGQWDMDEGRGGRANDSSGQDNHATLVNGVGWTSDGYGDTPALAYGDSAGHLVTDGSVLLSNRSFTVSAWVRLSQEADHHQYVMWQWGTDASAFVLQYRSEGLWGFTVTSIEGGDVTWYELSSTSSPALTEWTQVVGVYDRDQAEIRIYVNGRVEDRAEATVQPSASGLLIGSSDAGQLYGTVDSVRAYQAALTDEQVAGLYDEQLDAG